MKKITTIILLTFNLITFAQVVTLGAGTDVNGTTESGPVNTWYRRTISQFIYTAAELSAAGLQSGVPINSLGFYIETAPLYTIPGFQAGMKHSGASDVTGNLDGGYTAVINAFDYTPTAGDFDMLSLDASFTWDGTSSIVVQLCWDQVQPTYDASGQSRRYNYTSGYKYTWTDAAGNSCGDSPATIVNTKPIIQFIHFTETVWTGATDTDWFTASNWTAGVPTSLLDARIPTGLGTYPVINGNAVCKDLSIELSATVQMQSGSDLSLTGNFDNLGTYTDNGGSLIFNGGTTNTLSTLGTIVLNRLEINNASDISIASGLVRIATELDIVDGLFDTNNSLTIVSDASGTGRIAELSHKCSYTIDMVDTWGDGWNGGFLTIAEDGTDIGTFQASGTGSSGNFTVDNGSTITVTYTAGAWENENSYTISDAVPTVILSDGTNPTAGLVYTGTSSCTFNNPISGEITMERFIGAGETWWRYFSSAVDGATVAEYQDDFITSGYAGSPFPDFPFTSIYYYEETQADGLGYEPVTSSGDVLGTGVGYQVWSGDTITGTTAFTVDLTGPPNAGPIAMPVTYTPGGTEDGWNYVGNPYPSTIDWDSPNWSKTNIGAAVYVLDPQTQNMTSYANGAATNSRTSLIPSQQGFWIRSTGGSPQLIGTEGVKSAIDEPFLKVIDLSPGMHISLNKDGLKDEIVLRHVDGATDDFDVDYDATKMNGSNYDFGQLSVENDMNVKLSIQSNSFSDNEIRTKLFTEIFVPGLYSIDFEDVEELDFSCLKLHDIALDQWYDVYEGASYEFELSDTLNGVRFELVKGQALDLNATNASCFNVNDGSIELSIADSSYQASILIDGEFSESIEVNEDLFLSDLAAGSYEIQLTNINGICENESIEVIVSSNDELISNETITYNETEINVVLAIQGGAAPYTVEWNNGQEGVNAVFTQAGTYLYTITDAAGCSIVDSVQTDGLLGVDEVSGNDESVVYNAYTNSLTYSIENIHNGEVELYTIDGKLVYKSSFKQSTGIVSLDKIDSGVYQVLFKGSDNSKVFRFVK